jgi:c-di-GMP-binding flagellar brake protein YcgR
MRLEIGQKMYMARDEDADHYVTSLQDATEEYLLVGVPYYLGHPLILMKGDAVLVTCVGEDGVYRFSTVCRGRRLDRVILYVLSRPERVARIQRRRLVRLPVTLEVRGGEKTKHGSVQEYSRWYASDISGGGVSLIFDQPPAVGARLVLEFSLPAQGRPRQIFTEGKVKRVQLLEEEYGPPRFLVGIKFQGLSKADEDAIVAYIFRKMVEERGARGARHLTY